MPSDIALQITTGYEDTGLKKATSDVKAFGDQVNTTANASSQSMEGLFKRIERPIGMIAFSGIAETLTGIGDKGQTAGMMVERGLHAAGSALLYFNPLLGMVVIGATALYEVFSRLNKESELTDESLQKLFKTNEEGAKALNEAAKEATKMGSRKDLVLELTQQAKAMELSTQHAKDEAKAQLDAARATLQHVLATKADVVAQETGDTKRVAITKAQERLTEATKTYTAVLADNAQKQADADAKAKVSDDILKERADILHKMYLATAPIVEIQARLKKAVSDLDAVDTQILHTTNPEKLKALEDEHRGLMQLIADYNSVNKAGDDNAKKMGENAKETSQYAKAMMEDIATALEGGKDKQHNILEEMGKDMIKTTANYYAQKLQVQALADMASPLTFGIGLAELAAATAISAIGGGIAAAIGGSSGNGSTPSSATGQNNVTTPQAGGQNGSGPAQLQVYVQGGVIDDNFAANLAKRLSDVVQQNGVQLVSSNNLTVSY